jgi:hypothetical protein
MIVSLLMMPGMSRMEEPPGAASRRSERSGWCYMTGSAFTSAANVFMGTVNNRFLDKPSVQRPLCRSARFRRQLDD